MFALPTLTELFFQLIGGFLHASEWIGSRLEEVRQAAVASARLREQWRQVAGLGFGIAVGALAAAVTAALHGAPLAVFNLSIASICGSVTFWVAGVLIINSIDTS